MGFDIIITVFILLMGIIGYRNGFIYTFVRMIGWVVSIVLSFIIYPTVSTFLKTNTEFYDIIFVKISEKISDAGVAPDVWLHSLPDPIREVLSELTEDVSNSLALSVTNIVFAISSFLLTALAIKLAAFLLTSLFSKKKRGGIVGVVDGLLGLASGLVMGVAMTLLFLTLVIPFSTMTGNNFLLEALEGSLMTKEFFYQIFQPLL